MPAPRNHTNRHEIFSSPSQPVLVTILRLWHLARTIATPLYLVGREHLVTSGSNPWWTPCSSQPKVLSVPTDIGLQPRCREGASNACQNPPRAVWPRELGRMRASDTPPYYLGLSSTLMRGGRGVPQPRCGESGVCFSAGRFAMSPCLSSCQMVGEQRFRGEEAQTSICSQPESKRRLLHVYWRLAIGG